MTLILRLVFSRFSFYLGILKYKIQKAESKPHLRMRFSPFKGGFPPLIPIENREWSLIHMTRLPSFRIAFVTVFNDTPKVSAAHLGWTSTDLQRHSFIFRVLNPIFSQKVENGVLATLRAAIDEQAQAGDYYGPVGFMKMKGHPVIVKSNKLSHNTANAKRLWEISEKMTGVRF